MGDAIHTAPLWRTKADFVFGATVTDSGPGEYTAEQLWGRQIGDYVFELCCVPFLIYDLALGDVVETDIDYTLRRVLKPSGRYVFRVWFASSSAHDRDRVTTALSAAPIQTEWLGTNLLAIDVENRQEAATVSRLLQEHEEAGQVQYETGLVGRE